MVASTSLRRERTPGAVTIYPEQIVYALRQADSGTPIGDLCRQYGIAEQTFYAWSKKYV